MVEIVKTKWTREAFCSVCSHSWKFEVAVCRCAAVPVPHEHIEGERPKCVRCGGRAWKIEPVSA